MNPMAAVPMMAPGMQQPGMMQAMQPGTMHGGMHQPTAEEEARALLLKRERRRARKQVFVVLLTLTLLLLFGLVVWLFTWMSMSQVRTEALPDVQGAKWSAEMLVNYLDRRGLSFEVIEFQATPGVMARYELIFTSRGTERKKSKAMLYQLRDAEEALNDVKARTADESMDGNDSLTWGRFHFFGDPEAIDRIRNALK